jgi:hypothetical protein
LAAHQSRQMTGSGGTVNQIRCAGLQNDARRQGIAPCEGEDASCAEWSIEFTPHLSANSNNFG